MADIKPLTKDELTEVLKANREQQEIDAVKGIKYIRLPTLFQSIFGNRANGSLTVYSPNANEFDIEITRADERLAALIPRGVNARFGGSQAGAAAAAGHASLQAGLASTFSRKPVSSRFVLTVAC